MIDAHDGELTFTVVEDEAVYAQDRLRRLTAATVETVACYGKQAGSLLAEPDVAYLPTCAGHLRRPGTFSSTIRADPLRRERRATWPRR
ncbi:MAG: hypothetical protein R3A10_19195 [Caldilineaceae bacterium]